MKTVKHLFFVVFYLVLSTNAHSQDSLHVSSEFSVETKGQHNIAALNQNFDCINCRSRVVSDNPIHHLGIYAGVNHDLVLNKKYSLNTGLYLEERSHSGGNNTLSNLVIFPRIVLEANDSISKNGKFRYSIKGGDLWDEDINDMLRIYNIDYQGLIAKLYIDSLSFGFMTIGDLSLNVGLDLHQTYKFFTGFKRPRLYSEIAVTVNELVNVPLGRHPSSVDANIAGYSRFKLNNKVSFEGNIDVRQNPNMSPSLAAGLRMKYSNENLKLKSALRYYAERFNQGYNGSRPLYYSGWFNSFTGPQLYPLKNFYRDLSQWALYTHSGMTEILAFELTGSWEKNIYRKINGFAEVDLNYLFDLKQKSGSLYPMYNTGIQVNFLPEFYGRVSMTNKHMDLRNFYQTASASKAPFLALGVGMELGQI